MTKDVVFATEETYLKRHDERRKHERRGILSFACGGEVYGVDILWIREIIKLREITEVPRAPRFLLGVVTVRGLVMPVIDLRLRLRLDAAPLGRSARILVVMHKGERFGLLVDEVRGVVRFSDAQIEPPPPSLAPSEAPFLAGIGRYPEDGEERMVILLSLEAVLGFQVVRS
ncbi:MAG TPA: chemotaxis protein CheW [Polyangia bacterium]|nr:chemotaxis protein CheW [Polyangia bacterium]